MNLKQIKKEAAKLSWKDLSELADWAYKQGKKLELEALSDDTSGIKPKDLLKEFRDALPYSKDELDQVSSLEGGKLMSDFYQEKRVMGCRFEDDGDMLLVEWGKSEKNYFLAYVRQIISPKRDGDQNIQQLRLEFRYPRTPELERMKPGNRWFQSLKQLNDFDDLVLNSKLSRCFEDLSPTRVLLSCEAVE